MLSYSTPVQVIHIIQHFCGVGVARWLDLWFQMSPIPVMANKVLEQAPNLQLFQLAPDLHQLRSNLGDELKL